MITTGNLFFQCMYFIGWLPLNGYTDVKGVIREGSNKTCYLHNVTTVKAGCFYMRMAWITHTVSLYLQWYISMQTIRTPPSKVLNSLNLFLSRPHRQAKNTLYTRIVPWLLLFFIFEETCHLSTQKGKKYISTFILS